MKVNVLSDASARSLVRALVSAFVAEAAFPRTRRRRLDAVVDGFVGYTLEYAYPEDDLGEIQVKLETDADLVHVTVHDWGLPMLSAGGIFGPLPEPLAAIEKEADAVQLLNLGSGGKRLVADVPARSSGDDHARRTTSRRPRPSRARTCQMRSRSERRPPKTLRRSPSCCTRTTTSATCTRTSTCRGS